MLPKTHIQNWSAVINILIQKYLFDTTAICILWNDQLEIQLKNINNENHLVPILSISRLNLADSLLHDIVDFGPLHEKLEAVKVPHDELTRKLTISIETSHCESFIAFQQDIPHFASAFRNASTYSVWRSQRNKFIFAFSRDLMREDYFSDYLFQDQPNILIVEAENISSIAFDIHTTKFVGSLFDHPEELVLLNRYDTSTATFEWNQEISTAHKMKDLMGRELIIGAFDYRPFIVIDYDIQPQVYDWAEDNTRHSIHIDGTEIRYFKTFCEQHNCSLQFDSTIKDDWGSVYANYTGDGVKGLLLARKTQVSVNAMYPWTNEYRQLDMSAYIGRSGITCVVPVPSRLTSWNLPLKPFEFTLWLGVAGCLLLETVSLLIARHFENYLAKKPNNYWASSFKFGYATTLKLFISQASASTVSSTTVRTVLFSCYMIDIIITSIYGSGLASILTIPTLAEAADSLERLHKHHMIWTATSVAWLLSLKNVKDDPVFVELVQKYRVSTVDEMREWAKTENMGFIVERMMFGHFGNVDFITPEALNHLKLMIDDIYFQFTVAYVPRLWPFLSKLDFLIYNVHSSGFGKYWEWKVTADYMNANEQEQIDTSMHTNFDTGPVMLGIDNFGGLILVWLIGIGVSILAFGMEFWYYHKWQKTNKVRRNRNHFIE